MPIAFITTASERDMYVPAFIIRLRNRKITPASEAYLRFSDDEMHFYWFFIQGSIMNPETRWHLRRCWGMCERHSFGFVSAEAAYRHGFLMGQAVLYHDLMERALAAFDRRMPTQSLGAALGLRETEPCFMCKLGYTGEDPGIKLAPDVIEEGRNLEPIRDFAAETEPAWRDLVCGICAGTDSPMRCRKHFRSELIRGRSDPAGQHELVQTTFGHMLRYMQSFVWDYRFDPSIDERAALIVSIGWLTGWRPWLKLLGRQIG
jgi:hypothetical protein